MNYKNFLFRFIISAILLGASNPILSQEISFQLLKRSSCDSTPVIAEYVYYIKNEQGKRFSHTYDSILSNPYIIKLPNAGIYKLFIPTLPDIDSIVLNVPNKSRFTYTVLEDNTILKSGGMHSFNRYYNCDTLANGYSENLYDNGNIKLRGTFIKGNSRDSLVTYYSNGIKKKSIHIIKPYFEAKSQEFDSLSTLIKEVEVHNTLKKNSRSTKEFYSNGERKYFETNKNGIICFREYSINEKLVSRQTKKTRLDFFDSGNIKVSWEWKRKKSHDQFNYFITRKDFDITGRLKQVTIFEIWNIWEKQPPLNTFTYNWINEIRQIENEKTIKKLKDFDALDFLFL